MKKQSESLPLSKLAQLLRYSSMGGAALIMGIPCGYAQVYFDPDLGFVE